MENSTPKYQGKPTAYLDHNILDLIVKNPSIVFKTEVKNKYQVISSDERLVNGVRVNDFRKSITLTPLTA